MYVKPIITKKAIQPNLLGTVVAAIIVTAA
jgi:hypothetical protein